LKVIEHFCDRVSVMYLGKIVETATRDEIYEHPSHPYTQALFSAIPQVGAGKKKIQRSLTGEVPSPLNPPPGCHFHPRCPKAMATCSQSAPVPHALAPTHEVSCWLYPPATKETTSL
jgi:oligopeptide transport system ATP-binding protein